jgi:hypothetical protein
MRTGTTIGGEKYLIIWANLLNGVAHRPRQLSGRRVAQRHMRTGCFEAGLIRKNRRPALMAEDNIGAVRSIYNRGRCLIKSSLAFIRISVLAIQ